MPILSYKLRKKYRLAERLLEQSKSTLWNEAKHEWKFENVWWFDEYQTCLCGKYPIREVCELVNLETGERAYVGNCCVKSFFNIDLQDSIFTSMRKITQDINKAVHCRCVKYAFDKGWIDEGDLNFYLSICHKRKLSFKQKRNKVRINKEILNHVYRPNI